MNFNISTRELQQLVLWHRDQQYECAEEERYLDADDHKKRAEEISKLLTDKEPNL